MRIAIFSPTVSGIGGIETATRNLMQGFRALGDDTHLFLLGGSYDQAWLHGVEYTQIGSPQDARAARLAKYALGSVRAIASWRPDVIICSDVTTVQMARVGRLFSGARKVPIASWIHFPLNILRLKEKLHKADFHLAISEEIAQDLRAYLPAQRDRVFTIYNAVQADASFAVPRPAGAPVFLYAGRLNFDDHKRVNDILLAVAKLRGDWRLKIIGAAPEARPEDGTRLHALADELGIQGRIEWMGWQRDPWTAAGEVTALLLSSAREGFPMILLEAMSHGVACVASACTGTLEIMIPGENGWVYPIADVDELARHLQAIVDDPASLPPQAQVQRTALRFSAEAVAQRARDAIATVKAGIV
jgi:UDP-D-galactose:(glucosyl)LPS alpha-1,6-D-galactosyltransferase